MALAHSYLKHHALILNYLHHHLTHNKYTQLFTSSSQHLQYISSRLDLWSVRRKKASKEGISTPTNHKLSYSPQGDKPNNNR
ncbi:Uncharacterized protein TCM_010578 [Theobroma cacao]|uniref:Uncharacterized protein n=1 Tax=Theobroma cacao TaxID=3641 RepID=A0A061E7U1_THECC|nr:Uncharacterized protein TCM_010578 [Theobroma cacao]